MSHLSFQAKDSLSLGQAYELRNSVNVCSTLLQRVMLHETSILEMINIGMILTS